MVLAAILAPLICLPQAQATPYDVQERLQRFEVAWQMTADKTKRKASLQKMPNMPHELITSNFGAICQKLDAAVDALQGSEPRSARAVSIRCLPAVIAPGQKATVVASWAYVTESTKPVRVSVGGTSVTLEPGKSRSFSVSVVPPGGSADAANQKEFGLLLSASTDGLARNAYVSVVQRAKDRVAAIEKSPIHTVRTLAKRLQQVLEQPESVEIDLPFQDYLQLAEGMNQNSTPLWSLQDIPMASHESSVFRVWLPKEVCVEPSGAPEINLVVAFSGPLGSEFSFFESYGRGSAAKEAMKRNWGFVGVRSGDRSAAHVLDWILSERKLKIKNLFVIGYSSGGPYALELMSLSRKPNGTALFAPAMQSFPKEWLNQPIFYTVGSQEVGSILRNAQDIGRIYSTEPRFRFQEIDVCNHVTVPMESMAGAYEFFDKLAN